MSTPERPNPSPLAVDLQEALRWRCIGPHRGGRVVAVAGNVSDPMTFYFGACAGGVWKTTDGGRYWRNVSDGFFKTAAIGALAVSESDPNVIYAGTGETSIRGNVSHGDGVYKSTDGGRTWANVGLPDTRHIGRIQIHPENPDIVYVAALGHARGSNEERGVFRSTDGGESWEKVLYKSERAGSHDIAMDPNNPRILYAAIWQAQRYPWKLESGGPDCGLWRSTDAGESWEDVSRQPGFPEGLLGKIGVAVSRARPGRVWALVEAEDGAVFRSDDYGENWVRLSEQALLRTRPWYYMHITADPVDPDTVWVQNYSLWKSIDGGAAFERVPTPHGDDHALWIDPYDNRRMIEGNDGGACVTFNGGASWSSIFNQPTAQLYHVITDDRVPYRVYGSQQDNTAISIPSQVVDGAIHERDWFAPGGGESGYIAIKHDDPNIVVASGPAGRRAYNDIMTHYDHRTGQKWNITVWPELYGWGVGAESLRYRFQWTFPIMFSRHDPDVLLVASNHVHRSTDAGASFEVISPDLTRADPETLLPSGGPITRDNTGAEVYATIFALAESPVEAGLLWAGSDDGLIHLSRDWGESWANVTPGPDLLPDWAMISIIEPSPHDAATVYVAATRYKHDDTRPYLLKSNDYGQSWESIVSDIPEDEFTRVIREDPRQRGLLFAGTETGLYVSLDDGGSWQRWQGNLPVAPVADLVIKDADLVVATHGRSFWILDDIAPLRQVAAGVEPGAAHLFAPAPKVRLRSYARVPREPIPGVVNYGRADTSVVGYEAQGSGVAFLDAGENPPEGVVFRYALAEEPRAEITLAIADESGEPIRAFRSRDGALEASAGVHAFHWNLRYPGAVDVDEEFSSWSRPDGPLIVPGNYIAELIVDDVPVRQPFQVLPDPRVAATQDALVEQRDMLMEILGALDATNRLINRLARNLRQVRGWLDRTDDAGMHAAGETVLEEIERLLPLLIDVNIHRAQLYASGLHEKLNALFDSVDSADYAPPRQAREVFGELSAQLEQHVERVDGALAAKIQAFNDAVRATGLEATDL